MRLVDADGQHPDFADLCRALDEFLNQVAGGEQNRAAYLPHNTRDDIHDVILAYDGARAVGCAALRRLDDRRAEVKRVFVRPEYRGRGIARQMMGRLEDLARRQGYAELVLETGRPLTAAVALYRVLGYGEMPPYGPYADLPQSLCMRKELAGK